MKKAHCEICGKILKEISSSACAGEGTQRVRRFLKYVQEKCAICDGYKTTFVCPSYEQHHKEVAARKEYFICPACGGTGAVWKVGNYAPCYCVGGFWGAYLPRTLKGSSQVTIIEHPPPQIHCAICGGRLKEEVKCPVCSGSGKGLGFLNCSKCGGKGKVEMCINNNQSSHKINNCVTCWGSGVVKLDDYGAYKRCSDSLRPILESFIEDKGKKL